MVGSQPWKTAADLIYLAHQCAGNARSTNSREAARRFWKMANEYAERAAKLDGGIVRALDATVAICGYLVDHFLAVFAQGQTPIAGAVGRRSRSWDLRIGSFTRRGSRLVFVWAPRYAPERSKVLRRATQRLETLMIEKSY